MSILSFGFSIFSFFVIAFIKMRPNLVCMWHQGRTVLAITGDCKLAASIKSIRGTSAAKLDSFQLFWFRDPCIKFTFTNKVEAMYERSHVSLKESLTQLHV